MSCRRIKRSLEEYLKGELPPGQREAVERHLDGCQKCVTLAGKLALTRQALSSVRPVSLSENASSRILEAIKKEAAGGKVQEPSFLRSPRALAIGGAVAALLVAAAVVVGIMTVGDTGKETVTPRTAVEESKKALRDTAPGEGEYGTVNQGELAVPGPAQEARPLPLVTATSNDYSYDSLRSMFEHLEVMEKFASSYTMADAINLAPSYIRKATDEFEKLGGGGPMLEAMIAYTTFGEPALLLCYVENAKYQGLNVWIIGLCAPAKSGESVHLTRGEMWVMEPGKFEENPDSSLVLFLEQK